MITIGHTATTITDATVPMPMIIPDIASSMRIALAIVFTFIIPIHSVIPAPVCVGLFRHSANHPKAL